MAIKDLTGQINGYLELVERLRFDLKGHSSVWKCLCRCGNTCEVLVSNLPRTKSCGCLEREKPSHFKHGEARKRSETPLYKKWQKMKERCYNENCARYSQYGARGITVCDLWRHDSIEFLNWAHANGYEPGLEIDRIDVDGHYEPSNCRFVTKRENAGNRQASKRTRKGVVSAFVS